MAESSNVIDATATLVGGTVWKITVPLPAVWAHRLAMRDRMAAHKFAGAAEDALREALGLDEEEAEDGDGPRMGADEEDGKDADTEEPEGGDGT